MTLNHLKRRDRGGFTLIEILVVVTIIAILMSLLIVAVSKAMITGKQAAAQADIRQLDVAVENFKSKFNVPYIPSRIRLCEKFGYYGPQSGWSQLDFDSVEYIQRIFPRIDLAGWTTVGIDWNGNGQIDPVNDPQTGLPLGDAILEGDQCLVFFLGGIPLNAAGQPLNCQGFSTSPANPAAGTNDRIGPFYEGFTAGRLAKIPPGALNPRRSPNYFSLLDTYSQGDGGGNIGGILGPAAPYAYFSSYKTPGNYNRYGGSDCPVLGLLPYIRTNKYLNYSTHQIICAGLDHNFAPGGNWIPGVGFWGPMPFTNPTPPPPILQNSGFDDLSNFSDHKLGVP